MDGRLVDLSEEISLDKNIAHDIDLIVDSQLFPKNSSRIVEAIIAALEIGQGVVSTYDSEKKEETLFSTHAFSPNSGLSYSSLEPHDFSFNSPTGMCPKCNGLGFTQEFDLDKIIDPDKSIAQDCCLIASSYHTVRYGNIYNNLAEIYGFDVTTPWKKLPERAKQIFLYGTKKSGSRCTLYTPLGLLLGPIMCTGAVYCMRQTWRYMEAKSESYRKNMEALMRQGVCSECKGSRLRPYPAALS